MSKPISLDALVFRAISKPKWIKGGEVAPDAFFLKPETAEKKAEKTLSLLTEVNCSREICCRGLRDCYGELELLAGAILELKLELVDDSEDVNIPFHASILNLPQHEGETFAQAEFFAGELAKRVIQIKHRPKN